MRNSLLITLLLLATYLQCFESKHHNHEVHGEVLDGETHQNHNQRKLSDIWNKIKTKIINVWEAFKRITQNTKQHIQEYLQIIKEKIKKISKEFEQKLQKLENEFKKIIDNVISKGESVKNCVKDDKNVIESILKEILVNVSICISSNMTSIAKIEVSHDPLDFEDTVLRLIENNITANLKLCDENDEKCLDSLQDVLNNIDFASLNVSQKAHEVRSAINDSLDTIVACVAEGLTKASASILYETIQIIECVKESDN